VSLLYNVNTLKGGVKMSEDIIISRRRDGGALYHCKVVFNPKLARKEHKVKYWATEQEGVYEGIVKEIYNDGYIKMSNVDNYHILNKTIFIHEEQLCELVELGY
jgi:hypothetical protein